MLLQIKQTYVKNKAAKARGHSSFYDKQASAATLDELGGASPGISLRPKFGQTNVSKKVTEARAEKGRLRLTGSISQIKGKP